MSQEILNKAKELMQERTQKNGAPAWGLTEVAIEKGIELSQRYDVDVEMVSIALYLAHINFSPEIGSTVMKNHAILSGGEAEQLLAEWGMSAEETFSIAESIRLHHTKDHSKNIFYEVVKNAECYKFFTEEGLRAFVEHLHDRGLSQNEPHEYALVKISQKESYLTLDETQKDIEQKRSDILVQLSRIVEGVYFNKK